MVVSQFYPRRLRKPASLANPVLEWATRQAASIVGLYGDPAAKPTQKLSQTVASALAQSNHYPDLHSFLRPTVASRPGPVRTRSRTDPTHCLLLTRDSDRSSEEILSRLSQRGTARAYLAFPPSSSNIFTRLV